MIKVMHIDEITLDSRLQSRTEIDEETVYQYAEDIKAGDEFPAVLAYFDGINHYLADGYHRYHAHKRAQKVSILCEVVNGTIRDAILHSTSVNSKHGKQRTNADKRKSVMTLIDDFEWGMWSAIEMAKHCGVSPTFVSNLRAESGKTTDVVKYKTPSGKVMTKAKASGRAAKENNTDEPQKVKEEEPVNSRQEELDASSELIEHLTKENDELTINLALAKMGGTEEDQSEAKHIIDLLREELRVLKIELVAVKQSRDSFQKENGELKNQCSSYLRQLKKVA